MTERSDGAPRLRSLLRGIYIITLRKGAGGKATYEMKLQNSSANSFFKRSSLPPNIIKRDDPQPCFAILATHVTKLPGERRGREAGREGNAFRVSKTPTLFLTTLPVEGDGRERARGRQFSREKSGKSRR